MGDGKHDPDAAHVGRVQRLRRNLLRIVRRQPAPLHRRPAAAEPGRPRAGLLNRRPLSYTRAGSALLVAAAPCSLRRRLLCCLIGGAAMGDWDPDLYHRFRRYRAEPFEAILARLEAGGAKEQAVGRVVDRIVDLRIVDLGLRHRREHGGTRAPLCRMHDGRDGLVARDDRSRAQTARGSGTVASRTAELCAWGYPRIQRTVRIFWRTLARVLNDIL